jgi:Xaa-Pro dipeptidase
MPPNAPLFNSGARAVYGRGVSQPRRLETIDQIVVEYPVALRRYNVKTEWTILLGGVTDIQRHMYDTVRATLARMTELTRPGTTLKPMHRVWMKQGTAPTVSVPPGIRSG